MKPTETFLHWLSESAGPWVMGQVQISRRADGWELRQVEDAGAELQADPDWRSAREWVKTSAAGKYRPLKGENNLARGRAIGPLSDGALIECLNVIYPTAVANGVMFQEGTLRVTDFKETAGRQTGMYRVVGLTSEEQLSEVVAAVCETRCLKHRLWAPRVKTPVFTKEAWPLLCPEACSIFVASCRAKIKGQPLDTGHE
jgi:sirohydrochlorin cobaltochelatase